MNATFCPKYSLHKHASEVPQVWARWTPLFLSYANLSTWYTEADWAIYKADRRSTPIFVFSLGSGAICWNSKKQPTIALLSMEAEYSGVTVAACEAVWLKSILKDLGIPIKDPTPLYFDNVRSIYLAQSRQPLAIHTRP